MRRKPPRSGAKRKRPRAAARPKQASPPYSDAEISKLEEALRAADARFAGIVGISTDAIVSIDEEHRIVLFNHGAEAIFGYRADEVMGRPLSLLLPEATHAKHATHVRGFEASAIAARQMGARAPIEGRRSSGEIFPAEASISQMRIGGRRFFTAVLRDETERVRLLRAERSARADAEGAERRWHFLAEASALLDRSLDYETTLATLARLAIPQLADCAVIDVVTPEGGVRRLGAAHVDPAMAPTMEALRAFPHDETLPFLTRPVLQTGQMMRLASLSEADIEQLTQTAEHNMLVRALRPASLLALPLRQRERILGAIALLRCDHPRPYSDADVQLARELAHRAAQAVDNARLYGLAQEAIRARDDVLAVVSHDLRNPLAAISMCTTTLIERPPDSVEASAEILGTIRQSVAWMNRIIQDLLDMANIDAGRLSMRVERTPVEAIVAHARASLDAIAYSHAFDVHLAAGLPDVIADPGRIAQVISNLVANAVKYTPSGNAIALRAERAGKRAVRISVIDHGSGIPAASMPHIFERFWHDKRESGLSGTGLGLAIAKGIVEAHDGEIGATSTEGKGATVWFTVPTAP
jgi:PAS domain S-box-containing protein